MTSLQFHSDKSARAHFGCDSISSLYESLLHAPAQSAPMARQFLEEQLEKADALASDLPTDLRDLPAWVANNAKAVAQRYGLYLEERRAGGARRFFSSKAHALYFLRHMAPSKLVDGAWLYGTVKHANDWRYHGLIRTYLEELGDGDPALNHVLLYRNLLNEHDCMPTGALEDQLYVQGSIQLALGQMPEEYLPEMLGYNLGYEQLPLHLLISAFELNELGIDPYYFTLHVTIDNASSGHAHKAIEAVLDRLPNDRTQHEFLQRLRRGYLLNELGKGSTAVIESFDLEQELIAIIEAKGAFGQHMHSDYCRLEGRTINEWLATPGQSKQLLMALESKGWIKRDQDPQASRFWQLINGPGAAMFGVFNGYEKQLLWDWIAGAWQADAVRRANPFRARFRRRAMDQKTAEHPADATSASLEELIALIAPRSHFSPEGLRATRIFSKRLSQGALTR